MSLLDTASKQIDFQQKLMESRTYIAILSLHIVPLLPKIRDNSSDSLSAVLQHLPQFQLNLAPCFGFTCGQNDQRKCDGGGPSQQLGRESMSEKIKSQHKEICGHKELTNRLSFANISTGK